MIRIIRQMIYEYQLFVREHERLEKVEQVKRANEAKRRQDAIDAGEAVNVTVEKPTKRSGSGCLFGLLLISVLTLVFLAGRHSVPVVEPLDAGLAFVVFLVLAAVYRLFLYRIFRGLR